MPSTRTDRNVLSNSHVAAAMGLNGDQFGHAEMLSQGVNGVNTAPALKSLAAPYEGGEGGKAMKLELKDGNIYLGIGFGAAKSISGELVFQTGMVGYPESITDPSYRGQILVVTFPLAGNYGVPSRNTMDEVLHDLPAHFESSQIHVAGLVVASYSGEDYSHHLATSSLGTWLKEQGVPAMYGIDTRALTKRIREGGSMLGKIVTEVKGQSNGIVNGPNQQKEFTKAPSFEWIEWDDPNTKNLVADGEPDSPDKSKFGFLMSLASLHRSASSLHSTNKTSFVSSVWPSNKGRLRRYGTQIQSASLPGFQRSRGAGRTLGL